MSYEKHTWETGETITAEKLNNLEDGVASGGSGDNNNFIVPIVYDNVEDVYSTEVTFSQIMDAYESEKTIIGVYIYYNSGGVMSYKIFTDVAISKQAPQAPIEDFRFILKETVITSKSTTTEYMAIFGITEITIDSSSNVSVTKKAYSTDVTELQF